jgi:hypothetical protein
MREINIPTLTELVLVAVFVGCLLTVLYGLGG